MERRAVSAFLFASLLAGCAGRSTVSAVPTTDLSTVRAPQVAQSSPPSEFVSFLTPGNREAWSITSGPGNAMWMAASDTTTGATDIIKLAMDGTMSVFAAPVNEFVAYTVEGPDGNLWYTGFPFPLNGPSTINRMTPTGTFSSWPVSERPVVITSGPGKALWFTEIDYTGAGLTNLIGKVSTTGMVSEFSLGMNHLNLQGIAVGPDGNLWITESADVTSSTGFGGIAKVTPTGGVTQYPLPLGSQPLGIICYDGALWFGTSGSGGVGRFIDKITTGGVVTAYPAPTGTGIATSFADAPDGKLWFPGGTSTAQAIYRMESPGVYEQFIAPASLGGIGSIANGPDGNLWFVDRGSPQGVGAYVRLELGVSPSAVSLTVKHSQDVTVSESNYSGVWTAVSSDRTVATVATTNKRGTFVITGRSVGSATITFSDRMRNSSAASVTVK